MPHNGCYEKDVHILLVKFYIKMFAHLFGKYTTEQKSIQFFHINSITVVPDFNKEMETVQAC